MNENIQDGQFTEETSLLDRIADNLGAWLAAFVLTFAAATLLAIAVSAFIPFSFLLILKSWAGIWGLMLAKGALKNKMF